MDDDFWGLEGEAGTAGDSAEVTEDGLQRAAQVCVPPSEVHFVLATGFFKFEAILDLKPF